MTGGCSCEDNWELISSDESNKQKTNIMNQLTAKIQRIFSADLQKQYKAGLIDNCGELTQKGREEVDMLVRDLVDKQLTERADEIIAEEEK